jgi:hypothetical protein
MIHAGRAPTRRGREPSAPGVSPASKHRPYTTTPATGVAGVRWRMETTGIEPATSGLQTPFGI